MKKNKALKIKKMKARAIQRYLLASSKASLPSS